MPRETRPFVVVHQYSEQPECTVPYAQLDDAEGLAASIGRQGGDAQLYYERPSGQRNLLGTYGLGVTHTITPHGDRWACACGRGGVRKTGETAPGQGHLELVGPADEEA